MNTALRFESIWKACSPALIEEIVAFWKAEDVLPAGEDAEQRAQQAAVLARDENNRIVGISTAVARIVPRIGQPMYYYRMYSTAEHRGQGTGYALLENTQAALQSHAKSEDHATAIGIILEIENAKYEQRYRQAAWPMGFNFIGYSPRRLPLYAYYFPGALLLPPSDKSSA